MAPSSGNLFIASLSPLGSELLLSRSIAVALPLRTVLYSAEVTPTYAYFMTSGLASVVTTMAEGDSAELGVIGREGIVGSLHLLGPAHVPNHCFMQVEGSALRISFTDLQKAFRSSAEIRERILEFVQEQALCLGQVAVCHRLHDAEERLACWLLIVQDRTQSDILSLTQEFLAEMLGAQRTTVTMVAGTLQRSGLIEYRRGHVKILNRESLEAAACGCYQITKQLYNNLYKLPVPD